jgi:hypothetical protein
MPPKKRTARHRELTTAERMTAAIGPNPAQLVRAGLSPRKAEALEREWRLRIGVRLPPPLGLRRTPPLEPGVGIGKDVAKLNLKLPQVAQESQRIVSTSRRDLGENALS